VFTRQQRAPRHGDVPAREDADAAPLKGWSSTTVSLCSPITSILQSIPLKAFHADCEEDCQEEQRRIYVFLLFVSVIYTGESKQSTSFPCKCEKSIMI